MSEILNGNIKRVPDWDLVGKIVNICIEHADHEHRVVPPDLRERERWRHRHTDLENDFNNLRRRGNAHTGPALKSRKGTEEAVRLCDPLDLGVHRAVPSGDQEHSGDDDWPATPYLMREHDRQLRVHLRKAATGGPSVLVVLDGGSCTGKSRALYEALVEIVPAWPLLRPDNGTELLLMLQEGRFRQSTALWLDESQRHLYGRSAAQAADLLRRTLASTHGAIAVGALWTKPYFQELTAQGISPDLHAAARSLLLGSRTRRVTVPGRLTVNQQQEFEAVGKMSGDRRIAAALAASDQNGDVIQHLTGGPELLHAYTSSEGEPYTSGGFFMTTEQAVITAALDIRRLGCLAPISAKLLAEAADCYLSPQQRPSEPDWARSAITSVSTGLRPDGTRTDIRRTLTALRSLRAQPGDAETCYEPDDYLDQFARSAFRKNLIPVLAWKALLDNVTDLDDRVRLAEEAQLRGLYRLAMYLAFPAFKVGDSAATRIMGMRFIEAGQGEFGHELLRQAAEAGDPFARWVKDPKRDDQNYMTFALSEGDPGAMRVIGHRLLDTGQRQRGIEMLRQSAEAGHRGAMADLAELLSDEEAQHWRSILAEDDESAVDRLTDEGDYEKAEWLLRRMVLTGGPIPGPHTNQIVGSPGLMKLASWLESVGRFDEADQTRQFGILPGGDTDEPWESI